MDFAEAVAPHARERAAKAPGEELELQADEADDEPKRLAFFDLETEAWSRFVLGGFIDSSGLYHEFAWPEGEQELFDALLAEGPGVEIHAWNGGRYDFNWFLEKARQADVTCEISAAGAKVTRIKVKGGPTLRDPSALIPMSLEKAASIAGLVHDKETGVRCRCGEDCGGYCGFKQTGMEPEDRAGLSRYLRRDCEVGLAVVRAILAEGARSGYTLKGTIGGAAYATAKRVCGFSDAEWTPDSYFQTREGYFGGRVELYRPEAPGGFSCDLISAYPWALGETPVPVGERIVIAGPRAGRAFDRGKEGIYEADVHVPPLFVPPLPCRTGARVLFPIGDVSGSWTRIELAAALELGCQVRRWGRAIVWEAAEAICKPFVELAFGRRAEAMAAGNAGLKDWHKLIANSFTGKCAQQPEMERLILCPEPEDIRTCEADTCTFPTRALCERRKRSKRCCLHACHRTCGAYVALDPQGKLWSSAFFRLPDCGHVHWSAYLTAATRIEWRKQAVADGQDGRTMVYGDTDSIFSTEQRTRRIAVGDELGGWKDEGAWKNWRAVAPKVYSLDRPTGRKFKAKGLSGIDADEWDAFAEGGAATTERGVLSLKQAARQGGSLFARKRLSRQNRAGGEWFGGRRLGADGLTYPTTLKEFEDGAVQGWKKGLPPSEATRRR